VTASTDVREVARLGVALEEQLRAHPERSGEVAALLTSNAPGTPTFMTALGSLVHVGSPEAQRALLGSLREQPTPGAHVLVAHLGDLATPSREVEKVLRALADSKTEVRSTAQLALGALAAKVAPNDPVRADAIAQRAEADVLAAKSNDERSLLLGTLGNTGSERAVDVFRQLFSQSTVEIQQRLCASLRLVPGVDAEDLLLSALDTAPDFHVRLAAAEALALRRPTEDGIAKMRKHLVAATEPEALVRSVVLRHLWSLRSEIPGLEDDVRAMASGDPSLELRNVAQRVLAAG
jgi:hypothetical protein